MWLVLAFLSAALLGFYDAFKKESLRDNAVLPVLFLNTVFSSLVFLPFILLSFGAPDVLGGTMFDMPVAGWEEHKYILLKSFIVLSSWIFGYFGMKHLPLTIVGPINATRPVMVLIGALLFFGERLNLYQWIGVLLAVLSFFMLSRSGKKEGIDFKHNTSHAGAVVVQCLSGVHHVPHYPAPVVSAAKDNYPFPLEVDHCFHFPVSVCGRFCLFLCPQLRRLHDFHCLDGASRQCGGILPLWCPVLP